MQDTDLYHRILGLDESWQVVAVELELDSETVRVSVEFCGSYRCPECERSVPCHDHAPERSWRHLDTCQFQTLLRCRVPRVRCAEHGIKTMAVPWAAPHGRFTLLFEWVCIQWLRATRSQTAVADRLGLSFDQVHHIMTRAVERGLARRQLGAVRHLGLDEKSMKRGHKYLTVMSDIEQGAVLDVAEARTKASAEGLLDALAESTKATVECVCMDMWGPFREAAKAKLPRADVVHDRFHVSKHLNDAVDKTRRAEQRRLLAEGEARLTRTRYLFLRNFEDVSIDHLARFEAAKAVAVKTAAAWECKELFRGFWQQPTVGRGRTFLARWYKYARAHRLPPLRTVADMLVRHAEGLVNYIRHKVTNSIAENINGQIQHLKATARGFRSFAHYRVNILFHFGALDLNPLKSR
jgi:transposase